MHRRSTLYAWLAALGVLLHVGTAGASTWCKVMGLMAGPSCCPVESTEEAQWKAPSDCCKPALEAQEFGAAQLATTQAPCILHSLPWDRIAAEPARLPPWELEPEEVAASPPLVALASIVIVR